MSIVEKAIGKLRQGGPAPRLVTPATDAVEAVAVVNPAARSILRPSLVLDATRLRTMGLLPPESDAHRLATEYRRIKRPLVERAMGSTPGLLNPNVLLVASAAPGDGKTFTSLNLAMSLAMERDLSVLLVDADVPKRDLSNALGLDAAAGLLDVLADDTLDVETLIHDTDVRGLAVLPAGRRSPIATELLASQRMQHLIDRLNAEDPRRVVLFDSPPLLATTEANGVAAVCGQIVMVVRAGTTPRSAVAAALAQIGPGKQVGLVLNDAKSRWGDAYYGYGSYGAYAGKPA